MNKTDIEVWLRIYLPSGGDTDVRFRPLEYRSFGDWQDAVTETLEELNFVDYEVIIWDLIGRSDAHAIYQDESVWDKWNDLFDTSKDYGVPAEVIVKAASDMGYDDFTEFMENAYQGEADKMEDYAYDLLDDIGITEELAESYFDYDGFGLALKANGDLWSLIMEDWEDRYDTEAEAEAIYEDMYSSRNSEVAEWYIYDLVGDLKSALGDKVSDYFNYKSFARDLGYDGYDIVDGYVFRSY